MKIIDYDEAALMKRAFSAYFRFEVGNIQIQPSQYDSTVEEIKGKLYVILRNVNGILKVYRVRNDNKLKSLKRIPKEIEKEI